MKTGQWNLGFALLLICVMAASCSRQIPPVNPDGSRKDPDEFGAHLVALKRVMDGRADWELTYFIAYVVQDKQGYAGRLAERLSEHRPVVSADIVPVYKRGGAIDPATDKPVRVFFVATATLKDEAATIVVGQSAGDMDLAVWNVHLEKVGGRWTVKSRELRLVS